MATYKLVLAITCDQFAAAINDFYYAVLDDPSIEINGIDLRTLIQHIQMRYTQISQLDLDNNLAEFNTGIDPGHPLQYTYARKKNARSLPPTQASRSPMQRWSPQGANMPSPAIT